MNKYFAFISYKREDEEWAVWFHHELENYHLPATLNGRYGLPTEFRPVFRDTDELKAGNLSEQIHEALASSTYLIVICSPNAAKSAWVNKEIIEFIEIGKSKGIDNVRNIFPFIVDGKPHAKGEEIDEECFPRALLDLEENKEIVGGNVNEISKSNVNENGRDKAFVKVLAGMLPNVAFSELWNRYERDKAEQERLKREERDRFLKVQSRFVSEKILDIKYDSALSQLLALEILPKNFECPDRPYTIEAERALRYASSQMRYRLNIKDAIVFCFSQNSKFLACASDDFSISIWNIQNGLLLWGKDVKIAPFPRSIIFTPDNKQLITIFIDGKIGIWDVKNGELISSISLGDNISVNVGVNVASISTNGDFLAIATGTSTILLNLVTLAIKCYNYYFYSVSFNSIGNKIVGTTEEGLAIIDIEKGTVNMFNIIGSVKVDEDTEERITFDTANAVFSPDGRIVAFYFDAELGIIDLETGATQGISTQKNYFLSLAFNETGEMLTAVSDDGSISTWRFVIKDKFITHRNELHYPFCKIYETSADLTSNYSSYARLSPDMKSVAILDGKISIIVKNTFHSLFINAFGDKDSKDEKIKDVSFYGAHSEYILTDRLELWDWHTGLKIGKLSSEEQREIEKKIDNPNYYVKQKPDMTVILYDKNKDVVIRELKGHLDNINCDIYSPCGRYLVTSSNDKTIICWNIENGQIIWQNKKFNHEVLHLTYSNDGKYIAATTCEWINALVVCDAATGDILCSYNGLPDILVRVKFNNDGSYLATVDSKGYVAVFSFPTMQEIIKKISTLNSRQLTSEERKTYYIEDIE